MTDWRNWASCRETDRTGKPLHDPDLWFPAGTAGPFLLQIEEAKRVCYRCPVMELCGQWARETGQEYGVFGGLSEDERRAMKRRRAGRRAPRPKADRGEPLRWTSTNTADACRELFDQHTEPRDDGHVEWTAARTQVHLEHRDRTHLQVCFHAAYGRWPDGPVKRSCQVWQCVAPQCLTDRPMRDAQKRAAVAAGAAS